jgi:hypothetical protein
MKPRILILLGVAVWPGGLFPPPAAHAQMFNPSLEFVTQASASARDSQAGDDLPPDLILAMRTNAFSQLQTSVNLARTAAVGGTRADSQAAALASIQPLAVTLTGSVSVATTTVTNRANSAYALAAHRFDLLFDLPCAHEASLRTFLDGGVNPGSLLGHIKFQTGPEIVLWRLLPGDSGSATNRFTLDPGSFRLLVEFIVGSSAADGEGGGGAAAFSLQLDLAPVIPTLAIARVGTEVLLSWSTNSGGFRVEYRSGLEATNWLRLWKPVSVSGDQYTVVEPATEPQRFYHLAAP